MPNGPESRLLFCPRNRVPHRVFPLHPFRRISAVRPGHPDGRFVAHPGPLALLGTVGSALLLEEKDTLPPPSRDDDRDLAPDARGHHAAPLPIVALLGGGRLPANVAVDLHEWCIAPYHRALQGRRRSIPWQSSPGDPRC